jgi:hypothetical protein
MTIDGRGAGNGRETRLHRPAVGRRALFFWVATFVCVALVPATTPEFRWVAWATAGLGAFWATLFSLEDLFGPGGPPEMRFPPIESDQPFQPPPPPRRPRDRRE